MEAAVPKAPGMGEVHSQRLGITDSVIKIADGVDAVWTGLTFRVVDLID